MFMNTKIALGAAVVFIVVAGGIIFANFSEKNNLQNATGANARLTASQAGPADSGISPASPISQSSAAQPLTSLSLVDVAKHNTAEDCWTAIEGKVYNLTSYVNRHPGGPSILQACGKDGTSLFNSRPGSGDPHPLRARQMLEKLFVVGLKE